MIAKSLWHIGLPPLPRRAPLHHVELIEPATVNGKREPSSAARPLQGGRRHPPLRRSLRKRWAYL